MRVRACVRAGGFPSLDLLPGRVLPMEGDEGSDDLYDDSIAPVFASPLASSSFRPSSSSSSLPYRPFSSSSQRSSPPTPLAASGTLLSEFSFGSVGREEEDEEGGPPPFTLRRLPVVPSSASPRGEGEEEPAVFTDYRVEFASPLCALQAATLGICHLSATGHMPAPVSKAPLLPEEEPESGPA